jgi:hypothetical protein
MVSPTAKVDMVVPAKAKAHIEPMFLMNLQQQMTQLSVRVGTHSTAIC